ncbi:hypothetical protein I317_05433 [Kwoniella heveanensis CBS 569]|uniref:Uncharacterized protein n=1 Tax=Kwoniella heveanensis BCC8398 TaxID=1296120 RepID=A0A1B9GJR9_9TREE|nr:hypothetical protein I316_07192 [Kwoniella heveanensis BCC8398]OCF40738.1 hypothetical protein I317_05433 [Kwoniella heveanensis CBS 569]
MYSARSGGPASVAAPSFTFHHDHSVISSFGPGDLSEDCKRLLKIRARKGGRSCMVDSITSGFIQPSTGDFITEFPLDDNSRRTLVINQKGRCKNLDNDIKRWQREMQTARKDPSVVERREKIMRGGSFPADEATCLSGSSQQAGTEASGTVTNEAADSSEADLQNAHATESCQPPMTMPVAY